MSQIKKSLTYRPTDKTLADQLQITDREITYRKSLLDITAEEISLLQNAKEFVQSRITTIIDEFYNIQLAIPEINILIGDAETLERLRLSMHRYIVEIFEGDYGAEYVNKRLRIGMVHNRIGVSPKLYISALHMLKEIINGQLVDDPEVPFDHPDFIDRQRALDKVLMFDIQFVFDTYISSLVAEVNATKDELENYAETLEEIVAERTQQLQELSTTDDLTGLLNQRAFYDNLRRELSVAQRGGTELSLVYFDLNGFKAVNDEQGHKVGDQVLKNVGRATKECVRNIDIPCRYGGDEFCIIMPKSNAENAKIVCDRIVEFYDNLSNYDVTFSIGIEQAGPDLYPTADDFVKSADKLMYVAKAHSKKSLGHHFEINVSNVVDMPSSNVKS